MLIAGTWLTSQMLQMIDKPIVCWEVKKKTVQNREYKDSEDRIYLQIMTWCARFESYS